MAKKTNKEQSKKSIGSESKEREKIKDLFDENKSNVELNDVIKKSSINSIELNTGNNENQSYLGNNNPKKEFSFSENLYIEIHKSNALNYFSAGCIF